jgi:hypothetical protein
MLPAVGEASACSPTRASQAARACCTGRVASTCCCEPAKSESQSGSSDRTTVTPNADGRLASQPLCECRPGGPTEPASKPVSPSPERRTGQDRTGSDDRAFNVRPVVATDRLILPTESAPTVPLYIRTSRLLI